MGVGYVIEDSVLCFLQYLQRKTWGDWAIYCFWALFASCAVVFILPLSVFPIFIRVPLVTFFGFVMNYFTNKAIDFAKIPKQKRLALAQKQEKKNQENQAYTKLMETSRRRIHCLNCDYTYNGPLKQTGCPECRSTLVMFQTDWTAQVSGKMLIKKETARREVKSKIENITRESINYKGYELETSVNKEYFEVKIIKDKFTVYTFKNLDKDKCLAAAKEWCDLQIADHCYHVTTLNISGNSYQVFSRKQERGFRIMIKDNKGFSTAFAAPTVEDAIEICNNLFR